MLKDIIKGAGKALAVTLALVPIAAHAEITVLMSGGFALPYKALLPEFERTTGIKVVTTTGASQGSGPKTVKAQLQKGAHADVVILSKEGADELDVAGLIVKGSEVGLAKAPLGAAVRAGATKPDISTVTKFRETLLKARLISMPGSTSGIYIKNIVLPQLGIVDKTSVKIVERGLQSTQMLADGESDLALGPVSELLRQPGVDYIGKLPDEVQLVQEFTAALVKGSKQEKEVKQLIALLTSAKAAKEIREAGLEPVKLAVPGEVRGAIAPKGMLRAAINYGNPVLAQKDAVTGVPVGVSAELSRELARRLGIPVEFVEFTSAGKVADAAKAGSWDIAFLALDPERANEIAFTAPYVIIEGTYLVAKDSPMRSVEDVDRRGVRIAVGKGSAYDLYLTRAIKNGKIVRAPTSPTVIDVFKSQKLEVAAGVRQQLTAFASQDPDVRVMEGRFMIIEQAIGMPKGRDVAIPYLKHFVEDAKASGFVANALAHSGQEHVLVAPPSP